MAMELILDTINGAELTYTPEMNRRVRTGVITGINVSDANDPQVLEKAIQVAGLPGTGTTFPGAPSLVLRRLGVFPIAHDSVRVRLEYETISLISGITTAYLISDGSSLIQETVNIHPNGTPVRVGMLKAGSATNYIIKPQTIPMNVARPVRQISITAVLVGDPNNLSTVQNKIGSVNSLPWPANQSPLPTGYWLMNRWEKSVSKYSGYYQLQASAISRVVQSWMLQGAVVNPDTGQYQTPADADGISLSDDAYNGLVAALLARPYNYGQIIDGVLGMVNVGFYPTVDFAGVFGF